jgi:hypothetical protein
MTSRKQCAAASVRRRIDLGAATLATKGSLTPNMPDGVAGQFMETSTLARD